MLGNDLERKKQEIQSEIQDNSVVLYMKGSKLMPMCGFTQVVVHILTELGVHFLDKNVLEDDELRAAIKEFSNWPTIPQLYVKGEFIGGCDIVKELYKSGELESLLRGHGLI